MLFCKEILLEVSAQVIRIDYVIRLAGIVNKAAAAAIDAIVGAES